MISAWLLGVISLINMVHGYYHIYLNCAAPLNTQYIYYLSIDGLAFVINFNCSTAINSAVYANLTGVSNGFHSLVS